jgi:preprotein translocase subunit SecA
VPAIIDKVLRAGEGKILRKLHRIVDQVNSIEGDYEALSDAELRAADGRRGPAHGEHRRDEDR